MIPSNVLGKSFVSSELIRIFAEKFVLFGKLMMSYEKDNGITELLGSKDVVRQAFAMSIIENGEAWLEMIDDRNKTSHLYDEEMAADVIDEIVHTYYPLFIELQRKMDQMASK